MKKFTLSFRLTLTLLIWVAALLPAFFLGLRHFEGYSKLLAQEHKQEFINQSTVAINKSKVVLTEAMHALDVMAIDGSIISSASMDIMSVRALGHMSKFLEEHPTFFSIMIIDRDLFPTEALPTESLALDLASFVPFLNSIFNSSMSISDPQARFSLMKNKNISPTMPTNDYILAIARPILKPRESLTQPFEVVSTLFILANMSEVVKALMNFSDVDLNNIQLEIKYAGERVFSNVDVNVKSPQFLYTDDVVFGANPAFEVSVSSSKPAKLPYYQLLLKEKSVVIYIFILLVLILAAAMYLTRRLVRPVFELREMTEQLAQSNFDNVISSAHYKKSYFHEFNDLYLLLRKMASTIVEQLSQLRAKNVELEVTATALRNSVMEGELHHEIVTELMRFSIKIQHQKSLKNVGELTVKLLFLIVESPVGVVLYRSNYSDGYQSIERSPSSFQAFIEEKEHLNIGIHELKIINSEQKGFQLEPVIIDSKLRGYLVYRADSLEGFTLRAMNMLVMILRSCLIQKDLNYRLEIQASTDALTGLANRHYFDAKYQESLREYQHEKQHQEHFAIIVVDINGLKDINDTFGHASGDKLILKVAEILTGLFRQSDIVARVGGDEFYILLSNVNSSMCQTWLDSIQQDKNQHSVIFNAKRTIISFSCGFACTDSTLPEDLITVADARMYQAKSQYKKQKESLSGEE